MGFTLRDYFRKQKELLDDNRLLRIRLRRAEAARDRMADLLQAAGSERLTPLVHESCRGCVWLICNMTGTHSSWAAGNRTPVKALSRQQQSFGPKSGQNFY